MDTDFLRNLIKVINEAKEKDEDITRDLISMVIVSLQEFIAYESQRIKTKVEEALKRNSMLKGIQIRLYPTKEQVAYINKQFGYCRFVYNQSLTYRKRFLWKESTSISSSDSVKYIVELRANMNGWKNHIQSSTAVSKEYESGIWQFL